MPFVRVLFVFAVCLAASVTAAVAQEPSADVRRTITVTRLGPEERIVLDGHLDEQVWSRAEPAADFIQVDPNNGTPATEPTEVRIAYNSQSLYMGVTCYDSEPERWLGFERRRDQFLSSDDRFMWTIDTFLDARSGYFFEMNPSGLMADSLFGVNGDNRQWDGIWNARVRHTATGWTIEIEIPFRTLNFSPENDTWGMNFQRTVRRKNEDSIWMGWARNQGLRRMTNAGYVTGIREATQGHGIDIKPYGLFTSDGVGDGRMQRDATAGLDVFYNPTPGVRANLTINTDFAQTEVDQRQVNLTRFNLFFPEKRDFFLDGATFFDFGSPSTDLIVNPFFSRRIGLGSDNRPQRIDVGTKITGQMGGQDVGLLHVRTGEDHGLPSEDFTVGRVKRRMFRQSYVGGLYTRRAPRLDGRGAMHTAGVDVRLATNTFLGSQNLEATGWLLHASRPGVSSQNNAFGAGIAYPNDRWDIRMDVREVQRQFDPSMGFVSRRDYRRYHPTATFAPRPIGHPTIRRFLFSSQLDVQTTVANDLLVRTLLLTPFEVQLHSQDSVGVDVITSRESLDVPFTISVRPLITLPAGASYDFTRSRLRVQTANRRTLAVNARYEAGDFYSGRRTQTVLGLTLRASPGYIVYVNGEWNDVTLAEGRFSSNLYRLVGETQFTPFIALVNTLQFDTISRVFGWQSRFRWIVQPGNDLYLVYTHNWLESGLPDRFATLDRRFASKLLYTKRF